MSITSGKTHRDKILEEVLNYWKIEKGTGYALAVEQAIDKTLASLKKEGDKSPSSKEGEKV